jgi:four helix bundle protein
MATEIKGVMAARFEDVGVWAKANKWVMGVYRVSEGFPKKKQPGLTNQFRRAAVGITANFAEGFRQSQPAEKLRFFTISQESVKECRYCLELVQELGYAGTVTLVTDLDEISRMLDDYVVVEKKRTGGGALKETSRAGKDAKK